MIPEPWLWTEETLLELISLGVQESLELDYKRCDALQRTDAKKNEISKDVSAFANSAGGTIIYGMKEDGHLPKEIDAGFDPFDITKEWLEQVINSRIQRRIDGIRVSSISLPRTAPGRVAYAVSIPQSKHAPHQAADKRFYKRFNFESVPMEEYEVRDVSNRATSADLFLRFAFRPGGTEARLQPEDDGFYKAIQLCAVVRNESPAVAQFAVFHLYLDERIRIDSVSGDLQRHDDIDNLRVNDKEVRLVKFTTLWDSKKGLPIFEGITVDIPTPPLMMRIPRNVDSLVLRYTIGAPGMSPKGEYTFISVQSDLARLIEPTYSEVDGNVVARFVLGSDKAA